MFANVPDFTVIIPTHKRAFLLERALKSIREQKIDSRIEIIVISDVPDEETFVVCKKHLTDNDIFIKRNGEPGPSASRNLGLKIAGGRHIIFLDDDDAWNSNFIKLLEINYVDLKNDFIYVNCSVVKERRLPGAVEFLSERNLDIGKSLSLDVYVKNQIHMSCYIFPSYLIKGLEFDVSMRAYEDWDFLLSVLDRKFPKHLSILGSRVFEVDDDTSDRRGSSESAQDFNAVLDYLYVYRRHPAPNADIKGKRSDMLKQYGLNLSDKFI